MNRLALGLSFCCIVLIGCGGSGSAGSPVTTPATPIVPQTPLSVDSIVQQAANNSDVAGVIAYVQKQNQTANLYSAGLSNISNNTAITSSDQFKIASISKLFIAVGVTKLIAAERLRLNDSLALWLPELSSRIQNAESITIEHLIEHRSGVPDFDSQNGFSWENAHTSLSATLDFALDKPADFLADSRYEYSNTNYLLLGLIMNRLLSFNHEQMLIDDILIPLKLNDTVLQQTDADQQRLVHGYLSGIDRFDQVYAIPGGSMVSTVDDIGRFIRALNDGTLMTEQEQSLYRYFYNHSGWVPGYQSIAGYHQQTDSVVVVFVNSTGGASESVTRATYDSIIDNLE